MLKKTCLSLLPYDCMLDHACAQVPSERAHGFVLTISLLLTDDVSLVRQLCVTPRRSQKFTMTDKPWTWEYKRSLLCSGFLCTRIYIRVYTSSEAQRERNKKVDSIGYNSNAHCTPVSATTISSANSGTQKNRKKTKKNTKKLADFAENWYNFYIAPPPPPADTASAGSTVNGETDSTVSSMARLDANVLMRRKNYNRQQLIRTK